MPSALILDLRERSEAELNGVMALRPSNIKLKPGSGAPNAGSVSGFRWTDVRLNKHRNGESAMFSIISIINSSNNISDSPFLCISLPSAPLCLYAVGYSPSPSGADRPEASVKDYNLQKGTRTAPAVSGRQETLVATLFMALEQSERT